MILLDAHPLIAFLAAEPAEPEVRALLRERDAAITSVNLAEAIDILVRTRGVSPERIQAVVKPLLGRPLMVISVEARHAWRASALRIKHYHRSKRPVSIADCVLVATAEDGHTVASADSLVIAVAQEEGVDTLALPDSQGRRP